MLRPLVAATTLALLLAFGCQGPPLQSSSSPETAVGTALASQPRHADMPAVPAPSHEGMAAKTPTNHENVIPAVPKTPAALEMAEGRVTGEPMTLATLESLACSFNPTLAQAAAQVQATFGKAIQAGLYPNPRLSYVQEQIDVADTPGEFVGGTVQQEIVTAHKLKLSREKYNERTNVAQWMAMAQEYRVLNDVRVHFFRTLGRQQIVDVHAELLKNAEDHLLTTREKFNVGQANQADVHQANVNLQEARLALLMARNAHEESWHTLAALVGIDCPPAPLEGSLDAGECAHDWESALARITSESPEIQAAYAKLRADQITVQRERVEPIPNVFVRGGAGRNYEANETVGVLEVNLEVPLFDRNQGTIRQAEADLMRQQSEVRRTELRLKRMLATQFRRYSTAQQHSENFQQVILPEARKAYELLLDGYKQNRTAWSDVLAAEQKYFLLRETYMNHLIALREADVLINGYLLHGGLDTPMGVNPPGHLDAVPKPR